MRTTHGSVERAGRRCTKASLKRKRNQRIMCNPRPPRHNQPALRKRKTRPAKGNQPLSPRRNPLAPRKRNLRPAKLRKERPQWRKLRLPRSG